MKKTLLLLSLCLLSMGLLLISSCKEDAKDPGILPNIVFKTGGSYISSSKNIAKGSSVTIGINANKTEEVDVLKVFNISKSVNGAATTTEFQKSLTGPEGDNYSYDYTTTLDTVAGETEKFTFTVTNRDGLTNNVSLTLSLQ